MFLNTIGEQFKVLYFLRLPSNVESLSKCVDSETVSKLFLFIPGLLKHSYSSFLASVGQRIRGGTLVEAVLSLQCVEQDGEVKTMQQKQFQTVLVCGLWILAILLL